MEKTIPIRKLSIILTTHNERDIIERSLASVSGWSDDLVVVDSYSDDGTFEFLQAHPEVTVEQRTYAGPADQKNWAIERARHEWILLLDADEIVTPELRREIESLLAAADILFDAYWIPRSNYFMGRQIRHSGWGGDKVVRFFHRDKARYDDKQVHEEIMTEGIRVSKLTGKLEHYTFKNLDHFLDKTRRYARWSARDHATKTPRVGILHLFFKPLARFFKHYVQQGGFRDGKAGFVISATAAWGVFLRYVYMLEARSKAEDF